MGKRLIETDNIARSPPAIPRPIERERGERGNDYAIRNDNTKFLCLSCLPDRSALLRSAWSWGVEETSNKREKMKGE